ncbi:MAG: thioredoxin domain-containing protein [Opitutae bacterium]|nr:thioredoxin domain-containing protein [Opitutae bacterium]
MRKSIPEPSVIATLPEDGGTEFNRLIFESSPYLLQHARNPIDWYPWGDAAFKKASEEDKPVFLSIGYTTCHWCHVMEHESFEDEEVAKLMNRDYVCVKVDREERPDVDNVYMSVTQMMTGRGGWPMTIIMSPEKTPFFAGTYFPKNSMLQLVPHFSNIWKNERKKVNEVGKSIMKSLQEIQANRNGGDLNGTHLDACFNALRKNYDPQYGGFGNRPKFPTAHTLSFLLRYYKRTGEKEAIEMVKTTLQKIHQGGVYDQVGLGIHRYSVDNEWLVPHFEKMLYDQAIFTQASLECFQVTKDPYFSRIAEEVLTYVTRDMTSPEGGFYSAEDADSDGEEGKFYVWTQEEIERILGKKDAALFLKLYRFEKDGNFLDEATHQKTGVNIPHLRKSLDQHAKDQNQDSEEFRKKINSLHSKLFAYRKKRIHPQKDDKVLTDWNGLMISTFAQSAKALNQKKYLNIAQKAADFCLSELRQKNGRLLKRWRKGKAGLPGHLEDYAFLTQGLLDLYEASFEIKYLRASIELVDLTLKHFEDRTEGGFFLTANDGEKLLIRAKEIYDGAIPSGNSVMALNLLRVHKITGKEEYLNSAEDLFSAFSGFLEKNPQGAEVLLHALDFALAPAKEIVIAGEAGSKDTTRLIETINEHFMPAKVLLFRPTNIEKPEITTMSPFLINHGLIKGKAAAYICENQTCQKPLTDIAKLSKELAK